MVDVRPLTGKEAESRFEELARLRIAVFREWPYLYNGDLSYERDYLQTYFASPNAFIAGAFAGAKLVGACTATPLADHAAEFAAPLAARGLQPGNYFYFGESVLLPAWRGQGIGVRFFELREAEARRQGFPLCIFSAVARPDDHPAKPAHYVPLDAFWRKRGYAPVDGLAAAFAWKDVGDADDTAKRMVYWAKRLV